MSVRNRILGVCLTAGIVTAAAYDMVWVRLSDGSSIGGRPEEIKSIALSDDGEWVDVQLADGGS